MLQHDKFQNIYSEKKKPDKMSIYYIHKEEVGRKDQM